MSRRGRREPDAMSMTLLFMFSLVAYWAHFGERLGGGRPGWSFLTVMLLAMAWDALTIHERLR